MSFDKFKKVGTDIVKDVSSIAKNQYEKIKDDYNYEKMIRERKEVLDALDNAIFEKYKEIQIENDYLELLKGRVTVVKKHESGISQEELNEELKQSDDKITASQITRKHFSESIQRNVLKRQNNNCNVCHSFLTTMDFDHLDGDRSNNSEDNCQALCPRCHRMKSANERSK